MELNTIEKEQKMREIRKQTEKALDSLSVHNIFCAGISCFECPANIFGTGKITDHIVCIVNSAIKR